MHLIGRMKVLSQMTQAMLNSLPLGLTDLNPHVGGPQDLNQATQASLNFLPLELTDLAPTLQKV